MQSDWGTRSTVRAPESTSVKTGSHPRRFMAFSRLTRSQLMRDISHPQTELGLHEIPKREHGPIGEPNEYAQDYQQADQARHVLNARAKRLNELFRAAAL